MTHRIVKIDMTSETITSSEIPEDQSRLGGRALTSAAVCAEVEPTCHPLSAGR